ncbi:hypothetical protein [Pyrobaculum sp.]|uniref:hypothetical protein n=1 Tax=Pyrobaculum sp. TaxID=2004705 RepID=UPI003D147B7F
MTNYVKLGSLVIITSFILLLALLGLLIAGQTSTVFATAILVGVLNIAGFVFLALGLRGYGRVGAVLYLAGVLLAVFVLSTPLDLFQKALLAIPLSLAALAGLVLTSIALIKTREALAKTAGALLIASLAILVFAEIGYILWTPLPQPLPQPGSSGSSSFSDVVGVSTAYVFFNGSVSRGVSQLYGDAYVYVVAYQPGVALPDAVARQIALDAGEKPVYILPIPIYNTPINPEDYIDTIPTNTKNPVILLTYPLNKFATVQTWLQQIQNKFGQLQSNYIRIELSAGQPKSIRFF